ncbi:MAG: AN1-like Zinc finger [Methanoregula sp. PtaU1.Bin051]|nr:MAG: AN1-like Zinc finger [Methanoregula sp. PtaU1.Bin051]
MVSCDRCGKEEDIRMFCPYCGGRFCAEHRLPPSHDCINGDDWWFDQPANMETGGNNRLPGISRPPQTTDIAAGQRKKMARVLAIICIIAVIVIAGSAAGLWIAGIIQPQSQAGQLNTSGRQLTQPASAGSIAAAAPTPAPVLKVPVTIWITPVPTPLAGVISYPHINADTAGGTITRNYTFRFHNQTVSVAATVNRSVYNGAKNGQRTIVMNRQSADRYEWAPGYFRAFVDDRQQDGLYTGLITSLRTIRQEMKLSDDEYLELIAVFVQSLEYDDAGARNLDSGNRFPVETFVDGRGVCGDKSFLLAGLLARERYDVALLLFEPEKHMAIGIRADHDDYRNTSYAFLETTKVSFVGVVPDHLGGDIILKSTPQVIPLGEGGRKFSATDETTYIGDQSQMAKERIMRLEKEIRSSESNISRYNALAEEHNRYATLYNYISTHGYDRPGTYKYVVDHAITPPESGISSLPGPACAACNPAGNVSCPAGSLCCEADNTCYAPCNRGMWLPDTCVCKV